MLSDPAKAHVAMRPPHLSELDHIQIRAAAAAAASFPLPGEGAEGVSSITSLGCFCAFNVKKNQKKQSKAVTYLLGFFTSGDLRAKETFPEETQRRAVFCRRSHGEESGSQVILLSQTHDSHVRVQI